MNLKRPRLALALLLALTGCPSSTPSSPSPSPAAPPSPPAELPSALETATLGASASSEAAIASAVDAFDLGPSLSALVEGAFSKAQSFPGCTTDEECQEVGFELCFTDDQLGASYCSLRCAEDGDCVQLGERATCIDDPASPDAGLNVCRGPGEPCTGIDSFPLIDDCSTGGFRVLSCFDERVDEAPDPEDQHVRCPTPSVTLHTTTLILDFQDCEKTDEEGVTRTLNGIFRAAMVVGPLCTEPEPFPSSCTDDDQCASGVDAVCREGACCESIPVIQDIKTNDNTGFGDAAPISFATDLSTTGTLSMDFGTAGYRVCGGNEFQFTGNFVVGDKDGEGADVRRTTCKVCLAESIPPEDCCCEAADPAHTEVCDETGIAVCAAGDPILDPAVDACAP